MRMIKNQKQRYRRAGADCARVVSGLGPGRRAGRSATSINKGRGHQRQSARQQRSFESKTSARAGSDSSEWTDEWSCSESHKVPTFNMQMVVLSGGLSDKADYRGLASFTATLLREGTTKRSSKDIAEQVDALGATLTANSGLSSMTSTVNTGGLVENLDQTLELFADVVRNPTFPQAEVDKYKTRTLAQLQFQRSIPQFLARSSLAGRSMAQAIRRR